MESNEADKIQIGLKASSRKMIFFIKTINLYRKISKKNENNFFFNYLNINIKINYNHLNISNRRIQIVNNRM
jgi:hypothetical protein